MANMWTSALVGNGRNHSKPHPPIILGGATGPRHEDIIEYCDGFMPISGRYDFADRSLPSNRWHLMPVTESFDFGQFGTPLGRDR